MNDVNAVQTAGNTDYTYDADGNLLDDGIRTYTWDAANRLIRITDKATGDVSTFAYDGNSHRMLDTETDPSGSSVTTQYLWCGNHICEQRDASDTVTARYYSEGEVHDGQPYYYAQDQVGSVTALVDATFRAYDPQIGRWLNRDPIGERGGINLYGYADTNPERYTDMLGLDAHNESCPRKALDWGSKCRYLYNLNYKDCLLSCAALNYECEIQVAWCDIEYCAKKCRNANTLAQKFCGKGYFKMLHQCKQHSATKPTFKNQ